MSRDPRVFEAIEEQTYEQSRDRILVLKSALKGLSRLINDHLQEIDGLYENEIELVHHKLFESLIDNHLGNLTDEQIESALDQIEVELGISNED